jgi:hypothetical protein
VVTSATFRTFPTAPIAVATYNATFPTSQSSDFWSLAESFIASVPSIEAAGGSGYFTLIPSPSSLEFRVSSYWPNHTTSYPAINDTVLAVYRTAQKTGNATKLELETFPTMGRLYSTLFTGSDYTGLNALLGSRLFSTSFISSHSGPKKVVRALNKISKTVPESYMVGCMVAGGAVARNKHIDNAINPAWRRTALHLIFAAGLGPSASAEARAEVARLITEGGRVLTELEPDMGAYLNEADRNQPDWQKAFWGVNYGRLKAIKKEVDPEGLFTCRPCVGAEEWDDDGVCRVG